MNKLFFLIFLLLITYQSYSQGVAFSYFIPKNGEIAAPISPFSIRGIGIGKTIGIETGASFYFIPGLPAKDLPLSTTESIFGPLYTFLIPLQLFLDIPMGPARLKFTGGGFSWYNLAAKINNGNLDKALRKHTDWDVVNSDYHFKNQIGWGLISGLEIEFQITKSAALSIQTQYLKGSTKTPMKGSFSGGDLGGNITTSTLDFTKAKASLEGLEISIGISLIK
ncbi:MAG: hypothetical protein ACJA0X_002012 [Cyclobacteriaceae bacterium]|jgi:hypothetical protein